MTDASPMVGNPTRPVLRYHGGKWRLAPWIISHFPAHRVYVEPFGGAASVLLRKMRSEAEIYNDLDGEVVNVFRVLRDPAPAAELERRLRLTVYARDEFALAYEPADDPIERARRAIVRASMGYGSAAFNASHATGFRTYVNRKRAPVRDWTTYPEQIARFVERLAGVIVEQRPAATVMRTHDAPDALHYVDPPYPLSTRGSTRGVRQKYRLELTDDDHRELAAVLRSLRGAVVLSGYASPLYDEELYPDWRRVTKATHADGAEDRTEVLWLNRREAAPSLQEQEGIHD